MHVPPTDTAMATDMPMALDMDWADDAPEPHFVAMKALVIAARLLKPLSLEALRDQSHLDVLKVILAADYYEDFCSLPILYYIAATATPAAHVHREFALHLMTIELLECGLPPEGLPELFRLADRCFVARGAICSTCGLPMCMHYTVTRGRATDFHCRRGVSEAFGEQSGLAATPGRVSRIEVGASVKRFDTPTSVRARS